MIVGGSMNAMLEPTIPCWRPRRVSLLSHCARPESNREGCSARQVPSLLRLPFRHARGNGAVGVGFEPTQPVVAGWTVFKTARFNRSRTPPQGDPNGTQTLP